MDFPRRAELNVAGDRPVAGRVGKCAGTFFEVVCQTLLGGARARASVVAGYPALHQPAGHRYVVATAGSRQPRR